MRTAKFPLLAMHGVLQKFVKFMKWKYMASLCAYDGGYNAWPTRCNVSRERSTLRVPLSSVLRHENVCVIHTSASIQWVLMFHVACESS